VRHCHGFWKEATSNCDNGHQRGWVWQLFLAEEMKVTGVLFLVWWLAAKE
jgi:hypothetical protein